MLSSKPAVDPLLKSFNAGILAWILPGAGHFYLGNRGLAWTFLISISLAYGFGLLVGGLKTSIDPQTNVWLFLAELPLGLYTTVGFLIANALPAVDPNQPSALVSYYPESDIAQIYLAVAGLLNLIVIFDAITRAQTNGLPVFHPELEQKERARRAREQVRPPQPTPAPDSPAQER